MNAIFTCFVACGSNYAAIAAAADDQRLVAQGRVVALFDGCIKRVHINMQNMSALRPGHS